MSNESALPLSYMHATSWSPWKSILFPPQHLLRLLYTINPLRKRQGKSPSPIFLRFDKPRQRLQLDQLFKGHKMPPQDLDVERVAQVPEVDGRFSRRVRGTNVHAAAGERVRQHGDQGHEVAGLQQHLSLRLGLVEVGNISDLKNALASILNDGKLRQLIAQNALDEVREVYSWKKIGKQILGIYEQVCQAKPHLNWNLTSTKDSCRYRQTPHLL